MSKELIEQLAKEHGTIFDKSYRSIIPNGMVDYVFTSIEDLEAFAKAYQAAAPIDNVAAFEFDNNKVRADVLERLPLQATGYQIIDATIAVIRALIPDTQAKKGE
jgi:hypothetical protein